MLLLVGQCPLFSEWLEMRMKEREKNYYFLTEAISTTYLTSDENVLLMFNMYVFLRIYPYSGYLGCIYRVYSGYCYNPPQPTVKNEV